jgi:hypothetical protein
MGFGMCAARCKNQTVQQTLGNVSASGVRFLFFSSDAGSGPGGGIAPGICKTSSGVNSTTPGKQWFTATATNAGGASANCLLSAQYLAEFLGPSVPVGAVESCEGGTKVEPWTPPSGALFQRYILPLAPMAFKAVLWVSKPSRSSLPLPACLPASPHAHDTSISALTYNCTLRAEFATGPGGERRLLQRGPHKRHLVSPRVPAVDPGLEGGIWAAEPAFYLRRAVP